MARSVPDSQRHGARCGGRFRPALQGRHSLSDPVGSAGARGRLTGRLVIATHNAGKLRELDELLRAFDLTLLGAAALGLEEPEETGSTFRDNAVLKARAAAQASGIVALSDDSGLCVEALDGRVGGSLVFPPRGTDGFGSDPIFLPDGHDRTFGEMSSEEKHGIPADGSQALSHRARAFQMLARACLA